MKLNTIIKEDCLTYMKTLPDNCVDLVVTSPPYAEQRKTTYGGITETEYPQWIEEIGKEIYRILKPSGSFVLNIKEHINNGCVSTYVLESVLLLSKIFLWKDTYIWNKVNPFPTGGNKRLKNGFEYCYWFTKTDEYKFYPNNVLVRASEENFKNESKRKSTNPSQVTNGSGMSMHKRYCAEMVRPSNVITLMTDNSSHEHPATFPIELPTFFIKLMTDKQDVVYDPFTGSGTTLCAAKALMRNYIGTEIVDRYIEISNDRLKHSGGNLWSIIKNKEGN